MKNLSDESEQRLLNSSFEKGRQWERERKLFSVHIELTPRCNFSCVHCYLRDYHRVEQLSYEKVITILDILYEKACCSLRLPVGKYLFEKILWTFICMQNARDF